MRKKPMDARSAVPGPEVHLRAHAPKKLMGKLRLKGTIDKHDPRAAAAKTFIVFQISRSTRGTNETPDRTPNLATRNPEPGNPLPLRSRTRYPSGHESLSRASANMRLEMKAKI
jgi:hypothetical protein